MALNFEMHWLLASPEKAIPDDVVVKFFGYAKRASIRGDHQAALETFKSYFAIASDRAHYRSSNVEWAQGDLREMMDEAAKNSARFVEAFYESCQAIKKQDSDAVVPDVAFTNTLLRDNEINFEIRPPNLVLLKNGHGAQLIDVPARPQTLTDQALDMFQKSVHRSEQMLTQGHGREGIQELLWLLESVTTTFRDVPTEAGTVKGDYFNQIVRDLQNKKRGSTLDRALEWTKSLHGFLSSPTGGGVRHGMDFSNPNPIPMSAHEARLFANLIRSYMTYLLSEHEAMTGATNAQQSGWPWRG